MNDNCLVESLCRYIGQTVTIFTTSGGASGCGFTGVLASVSDNCVKLITDIGAAPTCPLGNTCGGCGSNNWGSFNNNWNWGNSWGNGCSNGCGCNNNWLGSVTEIPTCRIASFTHNAI